MFQLCLVLILYLQIIDSFKISSFLNCNLNRKLRREELQMKWSFTAQPGQGPRAEVVGPDGEYYFHPSKSAGIRGGPPNSLGKQMTIPIFPYSSVLLCEDRQNIINAYLEQTQDYSRKNCHFIALLTVSSY